MFGEKREFSPSPIRLPLSGDLDDDISQMKSLLRAKAESAIYDFFDNQIPDEIGEGDSTEYFADYAENSDSEDFDYIFEPQNLSSLNELDPIEKEIEEFKIFCQSCVPARPRFKVPLMSLNLMS